MLPRFTPANLGTVTEPLLRDQYALVLGDALRNISGVNVQTQSGVADYFLIRGYNSLDSGLVLVDGAIEPEVPFFQMYNVSRVELLKGPGGFLYGRNPLTGAMAGVVNIVRKQPEQGNFGRVGGAFGSYGTFEGVVELKVPPRSQQRAKLRLRGKGVPRKEERGDLIVELDVRVPDQLDEALATALRSASAAYSKPIREGIAL